MSEPEIELLLTAFGGWWRFVRRFDDGAGHLVEFLPGCVCDCEAIFRGFDTNATGRFGALNSEARMSVQGRLRVQERRESGHQFARFHRLAHRVGRPVRRMRRPTAAVDKSPRRIEAGNLAHRRT